MHILAGVLQALLRNWFSYEKNDILQSAVPTFMNMYHVTAVLTTATALNVKFKIRKNSIVKFQTKHLKRCFVMLFLLIPESNSVLLKEQIRIRIFSRIWIGLGASLSVQCGTICGWHEEQHEQVRWSFKSAVRHKKLEIKKWEASQSSFLARSDFFVCYRLLSSALRLFNHKVRMHNLIKTRNKNGLCRPCSMFSVLPVHLWLV